MPQKTPAAEGAHTTSRRRRGAFLVASVGYATMAAFRKTLEPLGIQPRQFATMRALAEAGGQSQRELSRALHIPASRLVALLDDLEERGLVERRPHPMDRRARSVQLTSDGRRTLDSLLPEVAAHERRILAGLNSSERRQLDALLGKIADNLSLEPDEHPGMRS